MRILKVIGLLLEYPDEVLWEINPKLVIVHLSGFGQSGDPKMVKRAAYDLTVMAYSGYMSQNGTQEQPMNPGPYAGDYFNSLIFINSVKKYTVSLALRLSVDAESVVVWGRVMAMACVAVLPLVLLFFAAQKYFVEGIATSGLKG